jgi:dihydroorotate dehydrogenase electron transfer subunit
MSKYIQDFKVVENKRLTNDIFILELISDNTLPELKPGQFAQVRVDGNNDVFLRRPISIHDVNYSGKTIKFMIQIAGKGTETLSNLKSGDFLNIIYPLGKSFSLPENNEKVLLIGGGCGVAPLLFLAKHFKSNGYEPDILLGFRNSERIIEYDEYLGTGNVFLTTEDGSRGEKGFAIQHSVLVATHYDRIYCCGPEAMMRAVARYCRTNGIRCEVSLENFMACGIGACLCCVVDTRKGHLCTCVDGPVFDINDLKW